ncbi:MAG TPA: cation:proton antiporter, partial [Vicinamibacterales bacterium]|nr:cation:proton antiporter [Vicinamibacterales bacterium]
MPASDLVRNLILVYAISLAAIVFLARLRVPPVVAMVAAGILAGPAGFGLVAQEQVDALAELGVIFLLFTVGLDFSLAELRRTLGRMVLAGLLQIAATALAVGAMGLALGLALPTAIFAGLFVALSSTAIVLKTLADRNALASPAARLATGVLLFQDLAVVVLLLLLPVLAGRTAGGGTVDLLVRGGLALGLVAAVARLVLPRLLRFVLGSGRREAFPLAILVASVGTAWASAQLGVPMAIGAFLGGLVIAESEFCHQAHAEVRPLRDVLSALFFVSLGLLVEARFVVTHVGTVVGLTILVVAVKAVTATVALLPLAPVRIAATAGLYLAQVGEFSFILGRAALALGIVGEPVWQALLAASIGSMLLAAPIVAAAPALTARLARERRRGAARPAKMPASGHVLVLGFGVGGRLVATTLRELGIEYVVLELNGRTVRAARREGEPILYGDATSPESLRRAGLEQARA